MVDAAHDPFPLLRTAEVGHALHRVAGPHPGGCGPATLPGLRQGWVLYAVVLERPVMAP